METLPAHLTSWPCWLARHHRSLAVDDRLDQTIVQALYASVESERHDDVENAVGDERITTVDILAGAGFHERGGAFVRAHSLADLVTDELRVLTVGLNPSPASADSGIGFARPGNRFWPAAMAAGLVTIDRDPDDALANHGVGFTDIVKRTTRAAAELSTDEFATGLARLERLARWLRPEAIVMIGLQGWRAAVDRKAISGWQATPLGDRPVYVMPSTSGLNARTSLDELTDHFLAVIAGRSVETRAD